MKRLAAVAAVCALAGSSFACGDDEEELSADDRRYCELVAEIEAEGEQAFSSIGDDASEDEVAAAQKAFIEEVDDELDELVEVAPDEIAEDVEAFDAFTRAQMNGEETEEVSDAKIVEWEEENCPS